MKSDCLKINSHIFGKLWSIKYITEIKIEKYIGTVIQLKKECWWEAYAINYSEFLTSE